MSWKGMPGALFIGDRTVDQAIEEISRIKGVDKSDVLIGTRDDPPDVTGCLIYAKCVGSGAVIWMRKGLKLNGQWFNWSYTDLP